MTTIDDRAELDRQIADLLGTFEAALVPGLDPHLEEAVLAAMAAVRLRGDAALAGRVFVAVGDTHRTLRGMLEELLARIGAAEDAIVALQGAREVGR